MLPERYNYETRQVVDPPYTLNPEIMESAYYLYHYTGDPKYKQRILNYYRDIISHCRTEVAYTVIADVRTHAKGDALETFFIAETMKYMYLPFWGEDKFRFRRVCFHHRSSSLPESAVYPDRKPKNGWAFRGSSSNGADLHVNKLSN